MALILGLDTSNYTTSTAVLDTETGKIHQEKQLLPVKAGEAGLRQSDAVFHHTRQLPELMERQAALLAKGKLAAVSASARPRNMEGSYMPCFLVGMGTARSIAAATGISLYETSHQIGHVLAALYSAKRLHLLRQPFLAFHVSGGTTDLLYCEPDEAHLLKITLWGGSLDLKAGQVIDRVGLMLGLEFPCGGALEQLAAKSSRVWHSLRPVLKGTDCCLSGLENQCRRMLEQGELPEDIASYCLEMVYETIFLMTQAARAQVGAIPVIYAGGVMSNQRMRPSMAAAVPGCCFAAPEYACDNAAGVAVYGALQEKKGGLWQF